MKAKIGKIVGRTATLGLLLAVLLVLLTAWGAMAGDLAADRGRETVQYELALTASASQIAVALPGGCDYVSLAPGSQVMQEPRLGQGGGEAIWAGPFPDGVLRFWLACAEGVTAPATLPAAGAEGDASLVEPLSSPSEAEAGAGHQDLDTCPCLARSALCDL